MSTYRGILALNIYQFSSKHIEEVRKLNKCWENACKYLPTYIYDYDSKLVRIVYEWFQFSCESKDRYILFDLEYADSIIRMEMDYIGEKKFFKEIGLNVFFEKIFVQSEKSFVQSEKSFHYSPSTPTNIILDLKYSSYTDYEGLTEGDLEYELIGYLNSQMQLIKFNGEDN